MYAIRSYYALRAWPDRQSYVEWSVNEKVAYEEALASSWCGLRSIVTMKHVGLNVAADPLMTSAYTGEKGGFVVLSADDPVITSYSIHYTKLYDGRTAG